ncbi:MAG TPA: response regulator [bacterium]|nr:response regulator [bacterium]
MKVLNIDDSTINNMLIENLLDKYGHNTLSIIEGSRFEEAIEDFRPDVILIDLMIPDKDGFEILENLKDKNITIPVVVITALNSKDVQKKLDGLGVKEYHTKPIDDNELIESIQKASPVC